MRFLPILLAVVCVLPLWASEPGQPLDCSDMVFLKPGLSCTPWVPYPCFGGWTGPGRLCFGTGSSAKFDNEGWLYYMGTLLGHHTDTCGLLDRVVIFRYNGVAAANALHPTRSRPVSLKGEEHRVCGRSRSRWPLRHGRG